MRAVWIDKGNDPNWDLLAKHNVNWVFIGLDEPDNAIRKRVWDIQARGLSAGVFAAWNWYPNTSGREFAWVVHERIAKLNLPGVVRVQLNDETHDPVRITGMLREWRYLRPTTLTSWTLEGHQGGWFTPMLVKAIKETKTRVVPQCYTGPMVPTDALAAVRDITKRGVPDNMVTPMYDGAALQPYSQGFIFTQGRLK